MVIKLLREQNVTIPAGTVIDVADHRAKWLVSVGAAEFAELPKKKEPTEKKAKKAEPKKTTKKKD